MHALQPKHTKLKQDEVDKLLKKYNISVAQLPKIKIDDKSIPENCAVGDVLKIERKDGDKATVYFRVITL